MSPYLSIIVPAYNEAEAIQAGKLHEIAAWCDKQAFDVELVVVDDGSEDDTATLASSALTGVATQVVRIPHAGKAGAIIAGIDAAKANVLLFTDMDQATPIVHASELLAAVDAGSDVVIGSRGFVRNGAPIQRKVMSWGQVLLRFALLGLTIPDTQCGFKAFRRSVAADVLNHLRSYNPARIGPRRGPSVTSGFDVEFLFVAMRLGYRVTSVPVNWHYADTRRVDLRHDAWRGARDLFTIAAARWRGAYVPKRDRPRVFAALPDEARGG